MNKEEFIKCPFDASIEKTREFRDALKAQNDKNEAKFINDMLDKAGSTVYKNLIAFHPGTYLAEFLDDQGVTIKLLATRTGLSSKIIGRLISREVSISPRIAKRLERATGVSSKIWVRLQYNYDKKEKEILNEVIQDVNLLKHSK